MLLDYCSGFEGIEVFTSANTESFPLTDIIDLDNDWTATNQKNGVEVLWGAKKSYLYFLNEHSRNSFDGQGALIQLWVNFGNNRVTASRDGNLIYFGNGNGSAYGPLTCLDVVGHEYTHLIIDQTSSFIYQNESGALSESFADIFGTILELLYDPNINNRDWNIGEDAHLTGTGFRNMSNPNDKSNPDTYMGDYWKQSVPIPLPVNDYGGVHFNCGVQNYWFYLLTEGGSGINDIGVNYEVNGIGLTKAAKIAYRNLTVYLTSNSEYADAVNGSIQASIDLYGVNSNEVQQVKNSWEAVGLYSTTLTPTTNVWPGDVNNDGRVNNMDISLQYLFINEQGTPRQQGGIQWQSYPANDWGIPQENGADIVHHDCDGNGVVNSLDHNAIIVNRDQTHTEGVFEPNGIASGGLSETEHQIYLQPTGNIQPNVITMDVFLENINHLDLNVFRGFFTVNYNSVDSSVTNLITDSDLLFTNSWLGNPSTNLLTDEKDFTVQNVIEAAFSRTDNAEAIGKGIIGQLTFAIDPKTNTETIMKFEVNGIGIYDLDNNRIDIEDEQIYVNIGTTNCESSLTILDATPFQNQYKSSGIIQTTGVIIIGTNQDVEYRANSVRLNAGFSTRAGADFKVRSSGCN